MKALRTAAFVLLLSCAALTAGASTSTRPNILFIMSHDHAAHAISAYGERLAKVALTPSGSALLMKVALAWFILFALALSAAPRPNVVFILTDDQGYGPLRVHGDVNIITPEMDRLHAESLRFTNFHVQPNCSPTRAILLTGRPPLKNGVWATIRGRSLLRRGESTLAESFRAGGYKTALFGKWHLGESHPFRPQDRGFEEVLIHGGGGVGNIQDYWSNDYFDDHYQHNGEWKQFPGYCTDVWFDEAMKYIEQQRDRPFFVMISTNTPHLPNVAPDEYLAPYRDNPALKAKPGAMEYYAMVTNIDANLGRLRAKLKALNLEKNTLLIFMSDNGTLPRFATWNAGMRGGKGTVWEGGHRVPFFLHWPAGFEGGRDIDALTSGMDLRPTLEELCGLPSVPGAEEDGRSLVPLIRGQTPGWIDRFICLDLQNQQQTPREDSSHVVMQGHWRLTVEAPRALEARAVASAPAPSGAEGELHHLATDPGQEDDLKTRHPERVRAMKAAYARWWQTLNVGDPAAGHELVIGSDRENPTTLNTHDISGEVAWNHDQALAGFRATGTWEIDVARDGDYEFALRRYPVEAGSPIRGTVPVPEKLRKFLYYSPGYDYAVNPERSRALPVASAFLKIGSFEARKQVPAKAEESADYEVNARGEVLAVNFSTRLRAGVTKLEASFSDEAGKHLTAPYYITITRKTEP